MGSGYDTSGEIIELDYTTTYSENSPSGLYTNTASLEAYRYPDTKAEGGRSLMLSDAVHDIYIDGVGLAVGNVDVIAYFPTKNGKKGALIAWETSKPATSQIFYSRMGYGTPYDENKPNYGGENASLTFSEPKTKHAMILFGLEADTAYEYRIRAEAGEYVAIGGDYDFAVPASVARLTLAFPLFPTTYVAGVATTKPTTATAPAIPNPVTTPSPVPAIKSEPPTPPEPESEPEPEKKGFGGLVNKVFGFFR